MVWSTNVDPLPVRKSSTDAGLQGHEGVVRETDQHVERTKSGDGDHQRKRPSVSGDMAKQQNIFYLCYTRARNVLFGGSG